MYFYFFQVYLSIEHTEEPEYFSIEDNNKLVANVVLDFESRIFYSIVIKAEDEEGEFILKTFELEVIYILCLHYNKNVTEHLSP